MWLAAVCSLIERAPADLAVREPAGDETQDLDLPGREPRRRQDRPARRVDSLEQRPHSDPLG